MALNFLEFLNFIILLPKLNIMKYSIKTLFVLFIVHYSLFTIHCEAQVTQLWGMTFAGGGPDSSGTIFRIFTDGSGFQVKHTFTKVTGSNPRGNMIFVNGELYGMTDSGGTKNGGVIFQFDPTYNIYSVLYNFDTARYSIDTLSGKWPSGSLTYIGNDMLFGMANAGGSAKKGVIFSFNLATNQYSVVHNFLGIDGQFPLGSLYLGTNTNFPASVGILYGMTPLGGADSAGVIFSLNPSTNAYTKLLDFSGTNGANPRGSLIQATDGNLYGLTYGGGDSSRGVLFTINPLNSSFGLTFTFHGNNGANPCNSLYQANNLKIYGTEIANKNGYNCGSLFSQVLSSGLHVDVINFVTKEYGRPYGNMIQASDGLLYGMAYICGHDSINAAPDSAGAIYSFTIGNNSSALLHIFNTADGANPYGDLIELPANTGIPEIANLSLSVSVYPNPVEDIVTFYINFSKEANFSLKIYDLLGQEIKSLNSNDKTVSIDRKGLESGMYFYQIIQSETSSIITGKLIIK